MPEHDLVDAAFTPERLNAIPMDERASEEMRAFSRRRHDDGAAHVTWWLWRTQEKHALTSLKPSQGSMFFLDCGRGPFAVTAAHVYEGFLEDRAERRVRGCQIGNVGFNPEERLIASGKNQGIDIATFRVTPEEIAATGKRIVQGTDGSWPPPPNIGEAVFFGGFPGDERIPIAAHEISFGLHSAMVPLTSHTDYQLCCQLDRESRVDVRGLGLPPEGYDLGGVSGGPMLQPVYRDGRWGWRLVGVLSEAVAAGSFERVTAVRAHFLLPDGRLSR
ncbi:hypothetical protein IVB36_31080 [Bradyrhizobium sp. 35]|uniref:hypothetical protein n=1 Tax=Bradyrhizobium sp. 35 TaxID=2782670 RepID=UPI001FFA35F6|nr:hypothetical protein [Bradyrhizobium sp. 35]MCK1455199.1 hypothetical protein [Bradyrhizobium sp. 35]